MSLKQEQPTPKAYSYLRFSTPEQMKGDSTRRQLALAREYAQRRGLDLDEELTFQDLGVSAYRGKNAQGGRLGDFLEACRKGIVPRGSYFLVENVDRLSRQTAWKAVRVLQDLCEEGITVVTLHDGKEYNEEVLGREPMAFFYPIIAFMTAHEESAKKAARLKEVWKAKHARAAAHEGITTSVCPAWLRLQRPSEKAALAFSEARFVPIPERVKIVKGIFKDVSMGVGTETIARRLNSKGVKPFGRGTQWHKSYIQKILRNPAAIGTYSPHVHEYHEGRHIKKPLKPIKDYFPKIISRELFEAVQAMRQGANSPLRGRHASAPLQNLFGGMARCPKCDGTMTRTMKGSSGKAGAPKLVCVSAKSGKGCQYRSVRYDDVVQGFMESFHVLLDKCPRKDPHGKKADARLEEIELEQDGVIQAIENLLDAVSGRNRPPAAVARIAELEAALEALRVEERTLREQRAARSRNLIEARAASLAKALNTGDKDVTTLNALLRQIFTKVVVDYEASELRFEWQHGGETAVRLPAWAEA